MTAHRPSAIRTRRLELRPYRTSDYEAWTEGFAARTKPRHPYDGGPLAPGRMSRAEFRALCCKHRALWRRDEVFIFGVFDRRTGAHLGGVDIGVVERRSTQRANLGYYIHNTWQGRGFAAEACKAALSFAFSALRLHRIEAVIDPDNHPSIALARSIGMTNTGLRPSFYFQAAAWADQIVFEAVDGIWSAGRDRRRPAPRR